MTELYYRYNAETRSIQDRSKHYAGQQFDSGATRLNFSYNPLSYLELNDWTAYIVFDVIGDDGNPMVYGPDSATRFDGYTFELPWDLTARVKTARVEFQLWLVRANIKIDDFTDLPTLESTDYELSNIAGFALRNSLKGRHPPGCHPGCPPAPTTQPDLMGLIRVLMEYGVMRPVRACYNEECGHYELSFRSYYGGEDMVIIDAPRMDEDGNILPQYLPLIDRWTNLDGRFLPTDENIASALLTYNALEGKTDKVATPPAWDEGYTYALGALAVASDGRVYRSVEDANIGKDPAEGDGWALVLDSTSLSSGEGEIPTVEDVGDIIDGKLDSIIINEWSEEPSSEMVPSEALIRSTFDEASSGLVADEWRDPLPTSMAPSQRLAKDAIDAKTDILQAIPAWDMSVTYTNGSTVLYEGAIYLSLASDNLNKVPTVAETFWAPLTGAGSGTDASCACGCSAVYKARIGNGVDTIIDVQHNLGSEDVFVELRDIPSRQYVKTTRRVITEDKIRLIFKEAPPSQSIMVIVTKNPDRANAVHEVIGDGVSTTFTIEHKMGVLDFFSGLRMNDGTGLLVYADVVAKSTTEIEVSFATPPDVDGIVFYACPCMTDSFSDWYVHTQDAPSDTWVINHNLNRVVAVYTMTEDGAEVSGAVVQDLNTLNTVTVSFTEPLTGIAYIR